MTIAIDQIRAQLDDGYELSKLRRDNVLRHARGWVSSVVDFILLGLPLVAPIPNLINLAIALTPVMGWVASIIAAVAFELLLFGSAEIILYLQDKQMRDGGYELALKIAIGCGAVFVAILLTLIAAYEVPEYGLAVLTLPFVSVISIAFLSLKRWADIRDSVAKDQAHYDDALIIARAKLDELTKKLEIERSKLDAATVQIKRLKASKPVSTTPVANDLSVQLDAEKHQSTGQNRTSKTVAIERMLDAYRQNPNATLADVGNLIGRSKSTVGNYLKELETANRVYVNGSVQVLE